MAASPEVCSKSENGINVLALDGGGIQGSSELYILRELICRISYDLGMRENELVRPCQLFHLIGGSGTGGLIALLLGRLGLDINKAIGYYEDLSRRTFASGVIDTNKWSKELEMAMKEIVNKEGGENKDDLPLINDNATKTIILSMKSLYRGNNPYIFRTYAVRKGRQTCSIWEAARATTANRGLFDGIVISTPEGVMKFVGTSTGNNNPTIRLLDEAKDIFPQKEFGAVVSIGAGHPGLIRLPRGKTIIQKTMEDICQDCEKKTHEIMERKADEDPNLKNKYWRFSVDQGMGSINLKDVNARLKVSANTVNYLAQPQVDLNIDAVVRVLLDSMPLVR